MFILQFTTNMGCSTSTEVRAVSPSMNTRQVHHQPHLQQFHSLPEYQNHAQPQPNHQQRSNHEDRQQQVHENNYSSVQHQNKPPPETDSTQQHQLSNNNPSPATDSDQQHQLSNNVNDQMSNRVSDQGEKTNTDQSKPYLKYTAPPQPLNPGSGLAIDIEFYLDLDSKIANSNVILSKEESVDDVKARLATYGVFGESYNVRELCGHNNTQGYMELFGFHGNVVLMPALFDLCSPYTFAIERARILENEPDLPESEYSSWGSHHTFKHPFPVPFYALHFDGLDSKTISLCMKKCRVGILRTGKKEEVEDLKQDANTLLQEISENIENPTQNHIEYKDQLLRACKKYEITLSSHGEIEEHKPSGNPNEQTFPLPDVFKTNPKLLQKWIEHWEKFETTVGPGDGWNFSLKQWEVFEKDSEDMKIDDTKLHRTELDTLPPLDLSIDGEAGWDVIPVDIVKNDVATPQQEEILKARENRKNFNDPVRMEKRRLAIEEYFVKTYDTKFKWASERAAEFRGFADSLVKAEKEFLALCEKS